jgi:hypothetical protein
MYRLWLTGTGKLLWSPRSRVMLIYPSFMKVAPRSASLTKGISNDAGRLVPFRCDEILSLVRSRPALSIDLIAADNPGSFIDDTPTAKLVRQVLGAISEFDKAMTVAKLRGARERKRREVGKCEGRNPKASRRLPLAPSQKTTASRASILRRSE